MTNLDNVRVAVKGNWYGRIGNKYRTMMETETGMTEADLVDFYAPATPNTFGWYLYKVLAKESTHWGCTNAANCTLSDDLI